MPPRGFALLKRIASATFDWALLIGLSTNSRFSSLFSFVSRFALSLRLLDKQCIPVTSIWRRI